MKLGQKVNFIRQFQNPETKEWEIQQKSGNIVSMHLDEKRRQMCHVAIDGQREQVVNVDAANINPSDIQIQVYEEYLEKVKSVTERGNQDVGELVEQYNKQVEELHDEVLGKPVELEE